MTARPASFFTLSVLADDDSGVGVGIRHHVFRVGDLSSTFMPSISSSSRNTLRATPAEAAMIRFGTNREPERTIVVIRRRNDGALA